MLYIPRTVYRTNRRGSPVHRVRSFLPSTLPPLVFGCAHLSLPPSFPHSLEAWLLLILQKVNHLLWVWLGKPNLILTTTLKV